MANVNAFGLPETKKDRKNRSTHARTGNPVLPSAQNPLPPTELQEAQSEAGQNISAAEEL